MAVRIYCDRCERVATIQDSVAEGARFKTLYCSCNNPHCGHSFVMHLSFSHSLSPSALDFEPETIERLRLLPRAQQRQLFSQLD